MKDKIEALVREFDAKYRRVKRSDVAMILDLKPSEITSQISAQTAKRNKGQYELVTIHYPERDDLDLSGLPELDDSLLDDAYDEFDRMMVEIVGADCYWIGPPDDKDNLGLYFTDLPAPATGS